MCNTYCSSTATMVTRAILNVTFYAHCLSCYELSTQFTAQAKLHEQSTTLRSTHIVCLVMNCPLSLQPRPSYMNNPQRYILRTLPVLLWTVHSVYSPGQVTWTILNVTFYAHCLSCYELSTQITAQVKLHTTDTLEIFQYLICPL